MRRDDALLQIGARGHDAVEQVRALLRLRGPQLRLGRRMGDVRVGVEAGIGEELGAPGRATEVRGRDLLDRGGRRRPAALGDEHDLVEGLAQFGGPGGRFGVEHAPCRGEALAHRRDAGRGSAVLAPRGVEGVARDPLVLGGGPRLRLGGLQLAAAFGEELAGVAFAQPVDDGALNRREGCLRLGRRRLGGCRGGGGAGHRVGRGRCRGRSPRLRLHRRVARGDRARMRLHGPIAGALGRAHAVRFDRTRGVRDDLGADRAGLPGDERRAKGRGRLGVSGLVQRGIGVMQDRGRLRERGVRGFPGVRRGAAVPSPRRRSRPLRPRSLAPRPSVRPPPP